jgi:CHAT domain-containing protein
VWFLSHPATTGSVLKLAVRPNPRSLTRLPRVSHVGWALVVLAACTPGEGAETEAPRGIVAELTRAVGPAPILGPRLSIAREPADCVSEAGCRETGTPSRRVSDVAGRASRAAMASVAPDALHASALFDLLWADDEGNSLRRSIQYLQTAARLDPRPAPVLADLSAAYLVRAERANSPRDLLEAVEAAERALQKDPANRAALFNRALGLERFGLMGEAGRSWRAYLAVDSTSDWAGAARVRLAEVSRVPTLPAAPGPNATDAELAAYAVADPQGARTMGWDVLLGEWGAAVLANDEATAADRLHRAEVLGNALERAGRDATLADAVHAIRAHAAKEGAARRLAVAHSSYAQGTNMYRAADYPGSASFFATAMESAAISPALEGWAKVFSGAVRVLSGNALSANAMLRGVAGSTEFVRYPALTGQSRLALATMLLRAGRYEAALDEAQMAAKLLGTADEREQEAAALGVAADAAFATGDLDMAFGAAHQAIRRLRRYPSSVSLHNLLYALAETADGTGYRRLALSAQAEDIEVAARTGKEIYQAEATLARARMLTSAEEFAAAQRDVARGRRFVSGIREPNARRWSEAELRLAEASLIVRTRPADAVAALDSVIAFFSARGASLRVFPALFARAQAHVALGNLESATADLDRAIVALAAQRSTMRTAGLKAALTNAARHVFDEAVLLHLQRGRADLALGVLDRGRAALASSDTPLPGSPSHPVGEVAITYAIIADRLMIWTLAEGKITARQTTLDTARLTRTIEAVHARLEEGAGEEATRGGLQQLYTMLIRPVEDRLTTGARLVIITDGELATVPFAALINERSGRYLIEDHPLRFSTSLADASRGRTWTRAPQSPLIVADPAFDEAGYPELGRLPGAVDEAATVTRLYPEAELLQGVRATPERVLAAWPHATLIHYAGHAVFDEERPERSYLVLAGPKRARLTAGDLATLDLRKVRLIVLSACRTIRSNRGRADGFSGLAGSLLSAGAGGVVGSTWRVDDEHAAAVLSAFHRAQRVSSDPVGALRAAQIDQLRGSNPQLRAPAAWAGFRYAGSN